jgi:DNA-binding IclR family transcriptional regulator
VSAYRDRNSTAERVLVILMMFDDDHVALSASEVAAQLGVARSTAYRYLQSLVTTGFVEEGDSGGFQLGPRVLELARIARRGSSLTALARPYLRQLADATGETVLLTRLTGATVLCLDRADGHSRGLRISYEPGETMPANAGASAHVLLAWLPEDDLDAVLSKVDLRSFTPDTITSASALRERLEQTRRHGYAVSRGELDDDVLGIAAPVRDSHDRVVAGISVAGPSSRIPESRTDALVLAVRDSASSLSARLRLLAP